MEIFEVDGGRVTEMEDKFVKHNTRAERRRMWKRDWKLIYSLDKKEE